MIPLRGLICPFYICFSPKYPEGKCWPFIKNFSVDCYCHEQYHYSYVLTAVIIIIFILVYLILLSIIYCNETLPLETEVQYNMILCMPGHNTYEYLTVFRIGPASDGFDYKNSYIDFQLFSSTTESIGIPIR